MELIYATHTKTLIVAHLEEGETLGTLTHGTGYIKVDAADPNYVELLKIDPQLETVVDPTEPRLPEPPPPEGNGVNGKKKAAAEKHAEPAKAEEEPHEAKHGSHHKK